MRKDFGWLRLSEIAMATSKLSSRQSTMTEHTRAVSSQTLTLLLAIRSQPAVFTSRRLAPFLGLAVMKRCASIFSCISLLMNALRACLVVLAGMRRFTLPLASSWHPRGFSSTQFNLSRKLRWGVGSTEILLSASQTRKRLALPLKVAATLKSLALRSAYCCVHCHSGLWCSPLCRAKEQFFGWEAQVPCFCPVHSSGRFV
mmetsp:Transcript_2959/g.6725  ORF Transcript_2959/g.6725 Transcript_2959/m.6725 type:complete len:201 (-) Transcript_2959:334-936(-)